MLGKYFSYSLDFYGRHDICETYTPCPAPYILWMLGVR